MTEENEKPNMGVFDTHKFLFTLNYEKKAKGHQIEFIDRDEQTKTIILEKIEIGTSPVSCKLFDGNQKRYIVPFIRILKIHHQGTLVWDNTDTNLSNVKVIKGFK